MKWISKLFAHREPTFVCVQTITRDDVRVTVSEYKRRCGHPGYLVELFVCVDGRDRWEQVACMPQDTVHGALTLLMDAARFIDKTMTELMQAELVDD